MTATGKTPSRQHGSHKAKAMGPTGDVGREVRVERLRKLVASNKYEVDTFKLALKILTKALSSA
jgi:anti-sigma28 factor (negative regulator of flagellin synthesis)